MALRGSPARRVPGNPMAGVFRDLNRAARAGRRRRRGGGPDNGDGVVQAEAVQPPEPRRKGLDRAVGAIVTAGPDGRAVWRFPAPFAACPAVGAVAVWAGPYGGGEVATVAVEEVTPKAVTVRVWRLAGGTVLPGPPGAEVHLTAVPAGGGGR